MQFKKCKNMHTRLTFEAWRIQRKKKLGNRVWISRAQSQSFSKVPPDNEPGKLSFNECLTE